MHAQHSIIHAALATACIAVAVNNVRAEPSGLNWESCPDIPSGSANLACAYLQVPLDYHNASAGYATLLVAKANATSGDPKGTIFMNPGGPGASGLTSVAIDGPKLMNHSGGFYDIVSWDPRGVGPYTYPGDVFCLSDEESATFWNGSIEVTGINWLGNFTNQTDLNNFYNQGPIIDRQYRALAEKCLQTSNGTNLRYIGTASTVRDLVSLADALQGPGTPITYWGLSYGTLVGAWFMDMFPDRVGHVILDGVVDATFVGTQQPYKTWRDQISSAEDVYNAFANACGLSGPGGCRLAPFEGATGADVVNYISSAIEVVHDHPLAGNVSMATLRSSLFDGLYQAQLWSSFANDTLASEVESILNSNMTQAARRSLAKRETFSLSYTETAVVCADSVDADPTLTIEDIFDEIVNVTRTVSHTFGASWPIPWFGCQYWPVRAVERAKGPFNKTLANRVLVIGNAYDNATPFLEAQNTADVLGSQAALVKQNGFGHTSIYQYSTCTINIIEAYLANGTLPTDQLTVCEIDDFVELFPGVKSVSVTVDNAGIKE
ncbi:alpha/beta-hydrolase [Trametes coccinea BRFM310]|uniref:Alpha/beta-hydrolase n=1 Tax=Trametes coccinea (strain BRFM310) TaxID=1353009 RepID=A0A1Y2I9Q1_TRAC3|nr:alpha/beta-hydrolase [Trametes coccinea BRFM310]